MLADRILLDVPGRVAAQVLQLAQRFGAVHGRELHVTTTSRNGNWRP